MTKKIKRVTMNGVSLKYSGGVWWHNSELVFENARDFDRFVAAGLITVEYEPDLVRCDHWGAPGCSDTCGHFLPHLEYQSCTSKQSCIYSRGTVACTCIPNAPGWAATLTAKCEHGELRTLPCWKCDMTQAWREGELEILAEGWKNWIHNPKPEFVNTKDHYRRRPKPVAPPDEIVEIPIKTGEHGVLLAELNGMLGCQVMLVHRVNNHASFRGYKFADGFVRKDLWRVVNDNATLEGKQQFIHATSVLLAKVAK